MEDPTVPVLHPLQNTTATTATENERLQNVVTAHFPFQWRLFPVSMMVISRFSSWPFPFQY
jgi:hypothetical protein